MTLLNILVLDLFQGVTERLPIRSSAHLDLADKQTGWPDRPLVDAALHPGTLFGEGAGCP